MTPMHRAPRTAWTILAALLVSLLAGPVAATADRDRVTAFLEVTGFDVALASIALSAGQAPQMLGLDASDFGADWSRVSSDVFDPEGMQEDAAGILLGTLDDDMLVAAVEFYASPLGQRLVAAENTAHMIEDDAERAAEGAAEVADMSNARRAILSRLSEAAGGADMAIRAIREVQVRFLTAASAAGVIDGVVDPDILRQLLSAGDDELRKDLEASALRDAALTYAGFTDEEMTRYAEALEAPAMRRVYDLMSAIQFEIMADRFETLAIRMADLHPGQEL